MFLSFSFHSLSIRIASTHSHGNEKTFLLCSPPPFSLLHWSTILIIKYFTRRHIFFFIFWFSIFCATVFNYCCLYASHSLFACNKTLMIFWFHLHNLKFIKKIAYIVSHCCSLDKMMLGGIQCSFSADAVHRDSVPNINDNVYRINIILLFRHYFPPYFDWQYKGKYFP